MYSLFILEQLMSLLNSDQLKQQLTSGIANKGLNQIPGMAGKLKANFDSNGFKSLSGNFNNIIKKSRRRGRASSPLRDLYKNNGGKTHKPITFPQDLDNEHYMMFHVMDRRRPSRESKITDRALRTVVLPIPSSLTNQHGVSYNNENLEAIGGLAAGRTTLGHVGHAGSDVVGKVMSRLGSLVSGGSSDADNTTKGELSAAATVAAVGALAKTKLGALATLGAVGGASQAIKGLGVAEGIAMNPHTAVLFDNVNFREFSFTYKFMARNPKESATISNIIDVFNYAMHPSTGKWGAGEVFEYPEEFEIEFADAIKTHMFKIGTCVLKNISVNYNGENMPVFFEDTGAPVSVEMTLAFQETRLVTKENLDGEGWALDFSSPDMEN